MEPTQTGVALWRPLVKIYTIQVSHVGTYLLVYYYLLQIL